MENNQALMPGIVASHWDTADPAPTEGTLLMRHSYREGGYDRADHSPGLTCEGIDAATTLGKSMREGCPASINSSPVPRCVDTAKLIAKGAGWDRSIEVRSELEKIFIADEKLLRPIVANAEKNDDFSFLHRHAKEESIPGLLDRGEGTKKLLEIFLKPGEYNLCITHDWLVASIKGALGLPPGKTANSWVEPLEGVVVQVSHQK